MHTKGYTQVIQYRHSEDDQINLQVRVAGSLNVPVQLLEQRRVYIKVKMGALRATLVQMFR